MKNFDPAQPANLILCPVDMDPHEKVVGWICCQVCNVRCYMYRPLMELLASGLKVQSALCVRCAKAAGVGPADIALEITPATVCKLKSTIAAYARRN